MFLRGRFVIEAYIEWKILSLSLSKLQAVKLNINLCFSSSLPDLISSFLKFKILLMYNPLMEGVITLTHTELQRLLQKQVNKAPNLERHLFVQNLFRLVLVWMKWVIKQLSYTYFYVFEFADASFCINCSFRGHPSNLKKEVDIVQEWTQK